MKLKTKLVFGILFSCFLNAQSQVSDSLLKNLEMNASPLQNISDSGTTHGNLLLKPELPLQKLPADSFDFKSRAKKINPLSDSLSVKGLLKKKLSVLPKDSSGFFKKQLKTLRPKGSISMGYDYGVLPFIAGGSFPAGGFKTEGKIGFNVFKLPLEATFFYTSYKSMLGLNNYFRVSFDVETYKEQMLSKYADKEKLLQEGLGKLQSEKQQLLQQMAYLDHLKNLQQNFKPDLSVPQIPNNFSGIPDSLIKTNNVLQGLNLPDTGTYGGAYRNYADSLKSISAQNIPFDQLSQKAKDSLFAQAYGIKNADSVLGKYNEYRAKYDSISKQLEQTQKRISDLQKLAQDPLKNNPYASKWQNILGGVKKFDIGLCYPNYSTFLVQNLPVKGLNLEYQKENKFFAFTYGTTVNNLLFNPSSVQNTLQNVRNLYNYFDFGNLTAGRKIIAAKFGVGTKEKSHFFIGFLAGLGQTSYLNPIENTPQYLQTKENNFVIELDAKQVFNKNVSVDVVAGKSAVRDGNLTLNSIQQNVNTIFSDFRSNALLGRLNLAVKKTKTNFTFTTRWVDPLFRSFGTGFLRSDNFRFEVKAEQYITSRIKYTLGFKREEDNLLRLYNYSNTLYAINNSLTLKINRHWNLRASYYPIVRNLDTPNGNIKTNNKITNFIVTFIPKSKNVSAQFNLVYNYYLVNTDSQRINFQNVAFVNQYQLKNGLRFSVNSSWFKNSLADSLNNNTVLSVVDGGYQFKNQSSVSVGGKISVRPNHQTQFGFVAKTSIKVLKKYSIETSVEKIMLGDFYNGFNTAMINKFPYYCSSRFIINF